MNFSRLPFMDERTAPLSAEEELAIAIRYRNGDTAAGKRLVETNLRMVQRVAIEYHRRFGFDLHEMLSAGCEALLVALPKFDPTRGTRFGTFASWQIRGMMNTTGFCLRSALASRNLQHRVDWSVGKTARRLAAENGCWTGVEDLSREVGISTETLTAFLGVLSGDVPLHRQVSEDEDEPLLLEDIIPSEDPTPEEAIQEVMDQEAQRRRLRDAARLLSPKERRVLRCRFLSEPPMTLREVAAEVGLVAERVRQIEIDALYRLRHAILGGASPSASPREIKLRAKNRKAARAVAQAR